MSNDKTKSVKSRAASAEKSAPAARPVAVIPPVRTPPLFRAIDWWTFGVTSLLVFIGYLLTLAPDLTLEDSGELAVASYYAGIPHPPGYPVWTIFTWFFANLVPISNIAFRVGLASALSGALACGLLAFMVSRGSSMMMEGVLDLKDINRRWENAICMVSGFVAGMLLGFNGYMWSQSVIVEVYAFSVLSLMLVLVCLLRWLYAPSQRRYLYWAFFLFGICFTNHQTLIVAAMGIEVLIIAVQPRLGRDFLLANSLCYVAGLILKASGYLTTFNSPPGQMNMMFVIFNIVGVASVVGFFWLAIKTKNILTEWKPVLIAGLLFLFGASFYLYMPLAGMSNPPMQWGYPRTVEGFIHALTRGQYEKANPTNFLNDPMRLVMQLGMLFEGVVDEFNWVYTLIALVPFLFYRRMQQRERAWLIGVVAIYLCLGVLLLILLNPPPDRQARELIRVFFTASHVMVAMLVGYGLTLTASYLDTHYEKFRPWGILGGAVAAAFALFSLALTTERMFGGEEGVSGLRTFFGGIRQAFDPDQYGMPIYAGLLLLGMTLVFLIAVIALRHHACIGLTLTLFALMPAHSILSHWFENEQRGHLFGYWFGHDMFTPPFGIYPEMSRDAVLYGGTDPGRFCPTYMIFNESFIPPSKKKHTDPNFDRRDVYIITQNALADGTYLMYIRAHYNKSQQIKYDLPFFQELLRPTKERELNYKTNLVARIAFHLLDRPFTALGDRIEKSRRCGSSYFKPSDFTDLPALAARLRPDAPDALSRWLFTNLTARTQALLTGNAAGRPLAAALARDLNGLLERELRDNAALQRLRARIEALEMETSDRAVRRRQQLEQEAAALRARGPLYQPERFEGIELSQHVRLFLRENPQGHTRIRLNRLLLEEAYPGLIAKSPGGVYPDREIYIATPEDSQRCFQEYLADAQRRAMMNPPQLKPGEDVRIQDGRVQVSGQVAVMAINGLITKVMFDRNPGHEFYVEESFPLDWMYPHLTPFGIIMKINREPLPELTQDILDKDHRFWREFSKRLIGDWITYDTPVKEIAEFVDRLYLRRNFRGFTGDRKFVRDDQAQKAFSKLRSSIGGVYAWRIGEAARKLQEIAAKPPTERAALQGEYNRLLAEQQRMIKEADFAFRQAFAFCPYSPEAVFRYVQLLLSLQRYEDAYLVARSCQKLDPYNAQVNNLVRQLEEARKFSAGTPPPANTLAQLEREFREQSNNFQAGFNYAGALFQAQQTNRALAVLDQILQNPQVDPNAVLFLAQTFVQMGDLGRLETTLARLVQVSPDSPEAWYDLAALKATVNKPAEALSALERALTLSTKRRAQNPKERDLYAEVARDHRFDGLRAQPEFQNLLTNR